MAHSSQQIRPQFSARKRLRRRRPARTGYLVGLCLASFVALGLLFGYVGFYRQPDVTSQWNAMLASGPGGGTIPGSRVTLGMTAKTIRNLHPGLRIDDTPDGAVSSFELDGTTHTLWYTGRSANDRVYRIRLETATTPQSPDQLVDAVSQLHGGPLSVSCTHPMLSTDKRCHFRWMMSGGMPLDIYSRISRDDSGRRSTRLTILAVDIDLRSDVQPARLGQRAAGLRF